MKSIAQKSLEFTSLFEAELLVQLMLIHWNHPLAKDAEFASDLLEDAAAFLRDACGGTQLIEDFAAEHLNFVAAVWYAEWVAVNSGGPEVEYAQGRKVWLDAVKRSLPSCFCDPDDLQAP